MAETALKVRVGKRGDLRLPAKLLQQARLQPEEEVTVRVEEKRVVVEHVQREFTHPSEVLEELHRQGKITLGNLGELLKDDLIPGLTSEEARRLLKGVRVPIEEYIRAERDKVA
jgi:antitoxin component of MazEF toxin-antitoxin module